MQPGARCGFQATSQGIQFWFLDKDGIANIVGPVTLLEDRGKGEFHLRATRGPSYRVMLNAEQVAEYRSLGGVIAGSSPPPPASRSQERWGFKKTQLAVFFWYRGGDSIKYLGPIVSLEHMQLDRYWLVTKDKRQPIRLSPEDVADFQRLGGTIVESSQQVLHSDTAASRLPKQISIPAPPGDQPELVSLSGNRKHLLSRSLSAFVRVLCPSVKNDPPKPLRWISKGRRVKLSGYTIDNPLTYFSEGTPAEDEASCIDVTFLFTPNPTYVFRSMTLPEAGLFRLAARRS